MQDKPDECGNCLIYRVLYVYSGLTKKFKIKKSSRRAPTGLDSVALKVWGITFRRVTAILIILIIKNNTYNTNQEKNKNKTYIFLILM